MPGTPLSLPEREEIAVALIEERTDEAADIGLASVGIPMGQDLEEIDRGQRPPHKSSPSSARTVRTASEKLSTRGQGGVEIDDRPLPNYLIANTQLLL